jgi:hypothetical protein
VGKSLERLALPPSLWGPHHVQNPAFSPHDLPHPPHLPDLSGSSPEAFWITGSWLSREGHRAEQHSCATCAAGDSGSYSDGSRSMGICFGGRHLSDLSVAREHGVQCCCSYMKRKDWEGSGRGTSDLWLDGPRKIAESGVRGRACGAVATITRLE